MEIRMFPLWKKDHWQNFCPVLTEKLKNVTLIDIWYQLVKCCWIVWWWRLHWWIKWGQSRTFSYQTEWEEGYTWSQQAVYHKMCYVTFVLCWLLTEEYSQSEHSPKRKLSWWYYSLKWEGYLQRFWDVAKPKCYWESTLDTTTWKIWLPYHLQHYQILDSSHPWCCTIQVQERDRFM